MKKTVEELILESGGLAVLDQLYLPSEGGGRVGVRFGLGAELFFSEPDRALTRERVLQVIEDYHGLFPGKLNRFLEDGHKRARKASDDLVELVRKDMVRVPVEEGYSTLIFGEHPSSVKNDDVTPYSFGTLIQRPEKERLSYFRTYFPVGSISAPGKCNFSLLLDTLLRWCSICQPVHGTAGLALLFIPGGVDTNAIPAVPMLKRFPGFDFIDGLAFSFEARTVHNRIKCVNWLTVMNDALVEELGGKAAMRQALEPWCKVHEYPGGVVVQAGIQPVLGDAHRQEIPEAYRLVARYTKPVRFEAYKEGLFRVPVQMNDLEETLSWIRRFD